MTCLQGGEENLPLGANKISENLMNSQELFRKMKQGIGLESNTDRMNSICGGPVAGGKKAH